MRVAPSGMHYPSYPPAEAGFIQGRESTWMPTDHKAQGRLTGAGSSDCPEVPPPQGGNCCEGRGSSPRHPGALPLLRATSLPGPGKLGRPAQPGCPRCLGDGASCRGYSLKRCSQVGPTHKGCTGCLGAAGAGLESRG